VQDVSDSAPRRCAVHFADG